jgi:hypothetical protein
LLSIPDHFNKLNDNEKKQGIEWAKNQLKKRFEGEVGVDMHYSEKSAFHKNRSERALYDTDKLKILICTHEFYDNPHSTGGLIFADFYEWLIFLAKKSKKTNYEWYIKNHPDCSKWTKKKINEFVNEHKHIKLVNEKISFFQLKEEGLNFIFTGHGTVGLEAPLLGIDVVNADINHPHIAYDFNWSPKNVTEFEGFIDNLENMKKKINKDKIYEYYFVQHKLTKIDDLVFDSYEGAKEIEKKHSKNLIDIFLDNFNEDRHKKIIDNFSKLI